MNYHFFYDSGTFGHFYLNPDTFTYSEQHDYGVDHVSPYSNTSLLNSLKSKFLLKDSTPYLVDVNGHTTHFFNIKSCAYYVKTFKSYYGFPTAQLLPSSFEVLPGKKIGNVLSSTGRSISSYQSARLPEFYTGKIIVEVPALGRITLQPYYSMVKRVYFHENAIVIYQPTVLTLVDSYNVKNYNVYVLYYADTRIPTNCCIKYLCNPTKYKKA